MGFHRIFGFHDRECDFSAPDCNDFDETVCPRASHRIVPEPSHQYITFIIVRMFQNHYITWKELIISTIAVGSLLLTLIPLLFKAGGKMASSREPK